MSPAVTFAPADLFVRATVEANALHRWLEGSAESEKYYGSSTIELDGEYAPRTLYIQFRALPAGWYAMRATVRGGDGREIARSEARLRVMENGPQP